MFRGKTAVYFDPSRLTLCWRPLSCWICSAKPAKAAAVAVARVPARRLTNGGWVGLLWLGKSFWSIKKKMMSRYQITQGYTRYTVYEIKWRYWQGFAQFLKSHFAPRELTSRRRKRSLRSCGRCPCIARRGIVPIFIEQNWNMARQFFDVFFMFVQFLNFWDKAKSSVWEQHFMLFESSLSSLDSLFVWFGCLCCIVLLYWLLWIFEFMTFALGDAGECTAVSRPSGHLLNFQRFFNLQSA